MFDVVLVANTIKDMSCEAVGVATAIPWLLGERCAVVSQDGITRYGKASITWRKKVAPLRFVAASKNAT